MWKIIKNCMKIYCNLCQKVLKFELILFFWDFCYSIIKKFFFQNIHSSWIFFLAEHRLSKRNQSTKNAPNLVKFELQILIGPTTKTIHNRRNLAEPSKENRHRKQTKENRHENKVPVVWLTEVNVVGHLMQRVLDL